MSDERVTVTEKLIAAALAIPTPHSVSARLVNAVNSLLFNVDFLQLSEMCPLSD